MVETISTIVTLSAPIMTLTGVVTYFFSTLAVQLWGGIWVRLGEEFRGGWTEGRRGGGGEEAPRGPKGGGGRPKCWPDAGLTALTFRRMSAQPAPVDVAELLAPMFVQLRAL